MDRTSRKLQNIKQTSIKSKTGHPSLAEVTKPEFRFINGNLYLVTKFNNQLWFRKMESNINDA